MASSVMTNNTARPLPLSRKASPFKDPRPAPCTPAKTAKVWDEYEEQARQNARKRDRASQTSQHQRNSASSEFGKGSRSSSSTARSSYDFKFRSVPIATSTAVATCKSCKQSITYASGICERCKKTIILSSSTGESTPPLSSAARNFASADLHSLEKKTLSEESNSQTINPPKRKGCPPALRLTNPPIRLDSLRLPQNTQDLMEPNRSRKASLTDPNEPFLRLQYAHQYATYTYSIPTTPTHPSTGPPSTIPSRVSTRPSSFAQMTSPLTKNAVMPSYTHHSSATPPELGQTHHHTSISSAPTLSPSLHHVSNALQNTTSAWDDWDSDGEEKVRLVGYWKRSGKDKSTAPTASKGKDKERGRADSKVSVSSVESQRSNEKQDRKSKSTVDRKSEKKQTKESSRSQSRRGKDSGAKVSSREKESYKRHEKRPSGFIRAISCGC